MIDTIVFRLHGINEINTGDLDVMAQRYGGITPFVVPEHQALYNAMMQYKGKYFKMNRIYNKTTNEYSVRSENEFLNNQNLKEHNLSWDFMEFRDGDKTKEIKLSTRGGLDVIENELPELMISSKGEVRTPSSISYVQFKLNPNAQFIEFEFSIPKYLYGHNLAEFIPQGDADIMYEEGKNFDFKKWNTQKKFLYNRLLKFIDKFLTDLCIRFKLEAMPNLNFIEIRRIDLCWNQYYKNKEDALRALKEKKKLNSKKHRKNQKNINSNGFETSLIYRSSSGSYFKIYHKGSEYCQSKGDLAKHLKINKNHITSKLKNFNPINDNQVKFKELYFDNSDILEKLFHDHTKGLPIRILKEKKKEIKPLVKKIQKNLPYDTAFLKSEMDKILRYEISLSTPFFKYHYKKNIFRKNDMYHQEAVKIYNKVKSTYDKRNSKAELRVMKWEHDLHKKLHAYFNRTISLVLSKSNKIKMFEQSSYNKRYQLFDYNPITKKYTIGRVNYQKTKLSGVDVGTFSEDMLLSCVNHFKKVIGYFDVDTIKPDLHISDKIKTYNDKVKNNQLLYNSMYHNEIYDYKGNVKIKGNKLITSPIQLLTEKERLQKNLQKINAAPLIGIINFLENKGGTMQAYFKHHKITPSSASRYRTQLEKFKVFENTLMTNEPIEEETDFSKVYENTENYPYRNKFYRNPKHYLYG